MVVSLHRLGKKSAFVATAAVAGFLPLLIALQQVQLVQGIKPGLVDGVVEDGTVKSIPRLS